MVSKTEHGGMDAPHGKASSSSSPSHDARSTSNGPTTSCDGWTMGPPPAKAMPRAAPTYVPGPPQGQPPMAAPMQQRPYGHAGYGENQGGSLQPPQQNRMEEPAQRATLSHMLRMTGELRAERGVQPAKAAADLGLRPVLRPQMTTSKAAASSTNPYVVLREEAADRVTVRSDSPALSVTSSSTA